MFKEDSLFVALGNFYDGYQGTRSIASKSAYTTQTINKLLKQEALMNL